MWLEVKLQNRRVNPVARSAAGKVLETKGCQKLQVRFVIAFCSIYYTLFHPGFLTVYAFFRQTLLVPSLNGEYPNIF